MTEKIRTRSGESLEVDLSLIPIRQRRRLQKYRAFRKAGFCPSLSVRFSRER